MEENRSYNDGGISESTSGLKGLRELNGINYKETATGIGNTAAGLRGFTELGYDSYYAAYKDYFDAHPEVDSSKAYARALIKQEVGNDAYKAKYKGLKFNEQVAKYNEEYDRKNPKKGTFDDVSEESIKESAIKANPEAAAILDAEYNELKKELDMAEKTAGYSQFDIANIKERMEDNRKDKDDLKNYFEFDENEIDSILGDSYYIGRYYEDNKGRTEVPKSKAFAKDAEAYATKIYYNVLRSDVDKNKYFQMFENLASDIDLYYRESLKYNNGEDGEDGMPHYIKPFVSDMDKPKLMSKYMAISALTGNENIANNWLAEELLKLRGENTPWIDKAKATLRGIGIDIASTITMTSGYLSPQANMVANMKMFEEIVAEEKANKLNFNDEPETTNGDVDQKTSIWEDFKNHMLKSTINNPVIMYGHDIQTAGSFVPKEIEYNTENEINKNDVSYSTGLQVLQQSGYTTGSILVSAFTGGVAGVVTNGTKAAAEAATKASLKAGIRSATRQAVKTGTKEALEKATAKLAKGIVVKTAGEIAEKVSRNILKYTFVPIVNSYAERTTDAIDVYNETLDNGKKKLEQLSYEEMKKNLEYDPETRTFLNEDFNKYYQEYSQINHRYNELYDMFKQFGDNYLPKTEQDAINYNAIVNELNRLSPLLQDELEKIAENYYNEKYKKVIDSDETRKKIEAEARDAFVKTSIVEGIIISTTDLALSGFFKLNNKMLRKMYSSGANQFIKTQGGKAIAKGSSIFKYAGRTVRDAVSEFIEEGSQNITQDVSKAIADSSMERYFYSQTNPESANELGSDMLNSMSVAYKAFGDSIKSKETLEAGWMGFLGGLLGAASTPVSAIRGIRQNHIDRKKYGYNWAETALGDVNSIWRSPFFYNATERRKEITESNRIAKEINDQLDSDPKFRAALESNVSVLDYVNSFIDARKRANQLDMDESDFGKNVATINMLSKLKGTTMYNEFYKTLNELEKADLNDPAIKDAVDKMRDELNDENRDKMSDEDLLNIIKQNVSDFKSLTKNYSNVMNEISEAYDGIIDDRTKNTLVYAELTKENRKKLQEEKESDIQKELDNNTLFKSQNEQQSLLSDSAKRLVAKYGSIENARKFINEETKKKKKDRTISKNRLENLKKDLKNEDKLEEQSKSSVLSASEIMKLDPISRAEMLFGKNRNKYSKEQIEVLKEIDKAGLSKEAKIAIVESARLQRNMDATEEILNNVKSSSQKMFEFQKELYVNAERKRLNKTSELFKDVKSYEEFEKIVNDEIEKGTLDYDSVILLGAMEKNQKNKEYYEKYIKTADGKKFATQTIDKIDMVGSNSHNKISKAVLNRLVAKSKAGENYTYADAVTIFESDELKQDLLRDGVDMDSLNETQRDDILRDIADYVNLLNNAITNYNSSIESFNKSHEADNRSTKDANGKEELINKKAYQENKNIIDPIFEKLSKIFMGYNETLSKEDIYIIASLFSRGNTMPIDAATDDIKLNKTNIKTVKDLNDIIKELKKSINTKKVLFGNNQNFEMIEQTLRGLTKIRDLCVNQTPIEVIANAIIDTNGEYAPKFDKRKLEELEKKRKRKLGKASEMKLSIKIESELTDDNEKAYYESHHITENQIWVCNNVEPKNVRMRLMKTDELLTKEISEYNNDNYPLAVVMQVNKSTPNAIKVGEEYYLIVGIADNSRRYVTEESTAMNELRDIMLTSNSEETEILKYDNGNYIEFGGWNIKATKNDNKANEDVFVRDYLMKPVDEGGLGLSEEDAYKHFKENSVVVNTVYERRQNGKIFRIDSFTYRDKQFTYENEVTRMPKDSDADRMSYKELAYINPNQEKSPKPVLNLLFTDISKIGYDGRELADLMMNENLYDEKFDKQGISFVHNMLKSLASSIQINGIKIFKTKSNDSVKKLTKDFSQIANAYFNFLSRKTSGSDFSFQCFYNSKEEKILIRFSYLNNKEDVLTIDKSELLNNANKKAEQPSWLPKLQAFMMNCILAKNTDGTYSYRTYTYGENDTVEYSVKPQITYDNFTDELRNLYNKTAEKFLQMYFRSGVLYMDKNRITQNVDGIESAAIKNESSDNANEESGKQGTVTKETVEEQRGKIEEIMNYLLGFEPVPKPDPKNYKNGEEDINYKIDLEKYNKFINTGEKHEGSMGVTTFIRDEDPSKVNNKRTEATEFGTGIDSLVRMCFEKSESPDETYMRILEMIRVQKGYKTSQEIKQEDIPFPGFTTKKMLREFINDIHNNLYGFFEERGEKIVPFEMKLWATLESSNGKFAKLSMIPDIVTVDGNGGIHIYDMKTYHAEAIKQEFNSFKPFGLNVVSGSVLKDNIDNSWRKQVSLYAHIFEKATGLHVESIGIVPIPVFYDKSKTNSNTTIGQVNPISKTEIVTNDDFKGRKSFTMKPIVYGDAIKIERMPIDEIGSRNWIEKSKINEVSENNSNDSNEGGSEPIANQEDNEEKVKDIHVNTEQAEEHLEEDGLPEFDPLKAMGFTEDDLGISDDTLDKLNKDCPS